MSVATTEITRISKRERKQRHKHSRLTMFGIVAGLLFVFGIMAAYASGPRVNGNTVILGQNLSGMPLDESVRALQQSYTASSPIAFEVQGKRVWKTLPEIGLKPDFTRIVTDVSSRLWWLGVPGNWHHRGELDAQRLGLVLRELEASLPKSKDARFITEGDKIRIEPSVVGLNVDVAQLEQMLWDTLRRPSTSIGVPVKEHKPAFSTEQARALNINRQLGAYTTRYPEDRVRSENVKLSAARFSGHIIGPGDKISFNKTVGPRSEEDGYKEANVFIGNRIEKGYGGGVCQVSTTVYNAALLANLEIIERHSHSMIVDYVPPGRDAAVVYGTLDLVIKNNTPGHILIVAESGVGYVTFRVFGDGPDVKVALETKTLSKTDYQIDTIKDPTMPVGKQEVTAGKAGYRVATYRVTTDAQQRTSRTLLHYSNYRPMNQVIKEGTKEAGS